MGRTSTRQGLEGLVSTRRDRPYWAGRSKHWIKVKNRSDDESGDGVLPVGQFPDLRT
jgi:ATP-dependent DNA ligase